MILAQSIGESPSPSRRRRKFNCVVPAKAGTQCDSQFDLTSNHSALVSSSLDLRRLDRAAIAGDLFARHRFFHEWHGVDRGGIDRTAMVLAGIVMKFEDRT